MRTDKQKESAISQGVAHMDINKSSQNGETNHETQCSDSGCKNCGENGRTRMQFESTPAHVAMFGPHGPRRRNRGRFCWGPPPFGQFPEGAPPPPPPMDGPSPFAPQFPPHMGVSNTHGYPPWMHGMSADVNKPPMGFFPPGPMGLASFYGPPGFAGRQGFPFPGMRRGRLMKWKKWGRKMAEQGGCGYGMCNEPQTCEEQKTRTEEKAPCEHDQKYDLTSSGSEDDSTTPNDGVGEFEQSFGAPPMTHLMMMQLHHLRMAKHHRMIAQQCAKRNQCIMKQRCRTMRKCGVSQEQIKAWRQKVKEWKKTNKPCCEGTSGEKEKEETTSEEEFDRDEAMA